MAINNVQQGNISNIKNKGSISNIGQGSINKSNNQSKDNSGLNFEGSLLGNINDNLLSIGAGVSTLIGGILGYDKEGRQALIDIVNGLKTDTKGTSKNLANALLSTYNVTLEDFGKMPLGELAGNILEGAWQHPIDTYFDFMSLKGLVNPTKKISKINPEDLKLGQKINQNEFLIREAEDTTKANVALHHTGNEFVKAIDNIEAKYSPEVISKAMQAVETIGFKRAPKDLLPAMQDLSKANDIYKTFTSMAGAKIYDDLDFATRELIAKEYNVPFSQTENIRKTMNIYEDTYQYVKENGIKPLFHLSPTIKHFGLAGDETTDLLKRAYGTMDYDVASKDIGKKSVSFVNKVIQSEVLKTPEKINAKIDQINKITGQNIKKLPTDNLLNKGMLQEVNNELKKTMLSTGVYLGGNVITTTLSILNNFNADALRKTFKNLPKFRLVGKLPEAQTPLIDKISKVNNYIYRPIASVDRYLENIATEYIYNLGTDKAKYMLSAIPSKVVTTNPALQALKGLVPFGSYPAAAVMEVAANIKGKPLKSLIYNQISKVGQEANIDAQENLGLEPNRTKAIRQDDKGELIQRSTVVTPIQAANMFMFGQYGDAIQIPVINFINKLASGKGNPKIFEVDGKQYQMENGIVTNAQGEKFNLLPAISYIGREMLGPVKFYNDIIIPMVTGNYVKNEQKLFNDIVTDAQYASMNSTTKRKVVDNARERIGKRILGVYDYKYYEPNKFISKSTKRKVIRKSLQQKQLDKSLGR